MGRDCLQRSAWGWMNGTPQVLEYVRPLVDPYKVDLKSFDDRHYRQLGGRLQPILDTIQSLHDMGFWLEIQRRADSTGRVSGGRVLGHSLACDCVSQRLQNDGST